jgi:hypothetical protein
LSERGPIDDIAIIIIMPVLVGEPLCQDSRFWSPVFENLSTRSVWVRGYVPSCQALDGAAPQKPGGHGACLVSKGARVMR